MTKKIDDILQELLDLATKRLKGKRRVVGVKVYFEDCGAMSTISLIQEFEFVEIISRKDPIRGKFPLFYNSNVFNKTLASLMLMKALGSLKSGEIKNYSNPMEEDSTCVKN